MCEVYTSMDFVIGVGCILIALIALGLIKTAYNWGFRDGVMQEMPKVLKVEAQLEDCKKYILESVEKPRKIEKTTKEPRTAFEYWIKWEK